MWKILRLTGAVALAPLAIQAEETRSLDAHEHGHGALNIAVEAGEIAMELEVPGADIVGFEYEATSDADLKAIETAIEDLEDPLSLFQFPAAAGCSLTEAHASLIEEDDHDDHDDHDHAQEGHDDHDDHAEEGHDDHDDHDHAEEGHDDHDDHAEGEARHTEFLAEYLMTCTAPAEIDSITFAYFDRFPNALELEVQVVTDTGAQAFEVERDEPVLDMKGVF